MIASILIKLSQIFSKQKTQFYVNLQAQIALGPRKQELDASF